MSSPTAVGRLLAAYINEFTDEEQERIAITTAMLKASEALLERRITVIKHTDTGLALECTSRNSAARYVAAVYRDEIGVRASCTCLSGRHHPVAPRCWHAAAARLLSDLGEGSHR